MADKHYELVQEWGWILFKDYLERANITKENFHERILYSVWRGVSIWRSREAFLMYYDRTWADSIGDLVAPVARYAGLKVDESPDRLVEMCPDAAAILRIGVGPYIEADKEVPDDTWLVICNQLKIDHKSLVGLSSPFVFAA